LIGVTQNDNDSDNKIRDATKVSEVGEVGEVGEVDEVEVGASKVLFLFLSVDTRTHPHRGASRYPTMAVRSSLLVFFPCSVVWLCCVWVSFLFFSFLFLALLKPLVVSV
jgi:hypothetical protein